MDGRRSKLLEQLGDGIIIFEPLTRAGAEMAEFQHLVGELLAMEGEGLVGRCLTHRGGRGGQEAPYDRIHVVRGLTRKGEAALAELRRQKAV